VGTCAEVTCLHSARAQGLQQFKILAIVSENGVAPCGKCREVILDHFRTPKNRGKLPHPTTQADGMNPLCGDQLSMTALVHGDTLEDIRFEGHGCAISQSAASMLTALMKGKTLEDVKLLSQAYKNMFGVHEKNEEPKNKFSSDDLGDLILRAAIKNFSYAAITSFFKRHKGFQTEYSHICQYSGQILYIEVF
jgi:SUF system NifU family Fe-S assembly protein